VLPGTGGTQRLARIVGKSLAIELMVKGETFSFDRAKELGLVNEIFPADSFWQQVLLYAKQFCPPHKASKAVGLIKRACSPARRCRSRAVWQLSASCSRQLFQSDDARKALPPTTRSAWRSSRGSEDRSLH